MQSQHLLVDQRRAGGGQRGDVLRADAANVTMFIFIFVIGVLHQLVTPIQWVMMSDTVDYGEWRNGKRLTGISFAGTLFVLKLGLALGGALIGWMLAGGGYNAAASSQNSATISIIIALFTIVPAICYLLSAIIAKRFYTLKTPFLVKMMAELAQGRVAISRISKACQRTKNFRTKRTLL
jgi:GPH family glycoside/pentoside/hexuronide:cation symporter